MNRKKKLIEIFFKDIVCDMEVYYKVRIIKNKIDNSLFRWIYKWLNYLFNVCGLIIVSINL